MADEGEDGPPPLEDMSPVLKSLKQMAQLKSIKKADSLVTKNTSITTAPNKLDQSDIDNVVRPKLKNPDPTPPSPCGFGGMKKGFLFGGSSENKKKNTQTSSSSGAATSSQVKSEAAADGLTHIKSNPSKAAEWMVMPEVQKMKDQLQQTDAWLTEDLLTKLGNNEKLMTMMADPRCEKALQEFQADPDKALAAYHHDKYIQEFFREFCDVLGSHYENLHNASYIGMGNPDAFRENEQVPPPPTTERKEELIREVTTTKKQTTINTAVPKPDPEEDAKVQKVLSDPKLVEILQSENIKDLIRSLKEDPEKAQKLLQQGGKEFQEKVRILVDMGLLAFQR